MAFADLVQFSVAGITHALGVGVEAMPLTAAALREIQSAQEARS